MKINEDSIDNLERDLKEIIYNKESLKSKLKNLRDILERVLKMIFDISIEERQGLGNLIFLLRNHPEAFGKRLQPRARKLNEFFRKWCHPRIQDPSYEDYKEHLDELIEFIEDVTDQKLDLESEKVIETSQEPMLDVNDSQKSLAYSFTRFKVTQEIYDDLVRNPTSDLKIIVTPKKGKHPKGEYLIPHNAAITFIRSKQGAYNWKNNKNFHQDGIPKDLRPYFKYS